MKKNYDDDDGRTIADMSTLERRSVLSGVMTGLVLDQKLSGKRSKQRSVEKKQALDKSERRMYTVGAMGAGLVIGLIFLAVFAAAIVLILLLAGQL